MNAKEAKELYLENKQKLEGINYYLGTIKKDALNGKSSSLFWAYEMESEEKYELEKLGYKLIDRKNSTGNPFMDEIEISRL